MTKVWKIGRLGIVWFKHSHARFDYWRWGFEYGRLMVSFRTGR